MARTYRRSTAATLLAHYKDPRRWHNQNNDFFTFVCLAFVKGIYIYIYTLLQYTMLNGGLLVTDTDSDRIGSVWIWFAKSSTNRSEFKSIDPKTTHNTYLQ